MDIEFTAEELDTIVESTEDAPYEYEKETHRERVRKKARIMRRILELKESA